MGNWGGEGRDDDKDGEATWDFAPKGDSSSGTPWKEDSDPFFGSGGSQKEWKEDVDGTDYTSERGSIEAVPPFSENPVPKEPGKSKEAGEKRKNQWKGGGLLSLQEKHGWPMTCGIIAGSELVSGAMVGGAIGAFQGVQKGMAEGGLQHPDFSRIVRASVLSNAIAIGFSLAIWKGTTCASLGIRKKHDIMNEAIGGFTAGMVFALPSRNPMNIAFSGMAYGTLSCVFGVLTGQYKM